jgi:hypothetical protein
MVIFGGHFGANAGYRKSESFFKGNGITFEKAMKFVDVNLKVCEVNSCDSHE